MAYHRVRWLVLGLCLLGAVGGCSDRNPQGRRAVSGTVTLDGTPIKAGNISFQPAQPSGISSGAMIRDGQYAIPADKGLPEGKYKVMIFAPKPGTGDPPAGAMPGDPVTPPQEMIPADYNVKSDKFIDVTQSGPYEFKFDIATKK